MKPLMLGVVVKSWLYYGVIYLCIWSASVNAS